MGYVFKVQGEEETKKTKTATKAKKAKK